MEDVEKIVSVIEASTGTNVEVIVTFDTKVAVDTAGVMKSVTAGAVWVLVRVEVTSTRSEQTTREGYWVGDEVEKTELLRV